MEQENLGAPRMASLWSIQSGMLGMSSVFGGRLRRIACGAVEAHDGEDGRRMGAYCIASWFHQLRVVDPWISARIPSCGLDAHKLLGVPAARSWERAFRVLQFFGRNIQDVAPLMQHASSHAADVR